MNQKSKKGGFNSKSLQSLSKKYTSQSRTNGSITIPKYSTGIIPLDKILNGGFPQGRAIGLGAGYGVGKTTLLLHICGSIIRNYGKRVYYIDVEGGATNDLIDSMGLIEHLYNPITNPEGKLIYLESSTIQMLSKAIKDIIEDPDAAVIVIDTATQVVDQHILEDGHLGTNKKGIGKEARMWSRASKSILPLIKKTEICLVLLHQSRVDFLPGGHAIKVAAGGNATRHMVSAEIWAKKDSYIDENYNPIHSKNNAIGTILELTTHKNRFAKPGVKVKIPIIFGQGVSETFLYKEWLLANSYKDHETQEKKPYLVQKKSWYYFNLPSRDTETKFQGNTKACAFIIKNAEEIRSLMNQN